MTPDTDIEKLADAADFFEQDAAKAWQFTPDKRKEIAAAIRRTI